MLRRVRGRNNWRRKHPIAIDLFSGPGGMTLGLKRAGYAVIGAAELDPLAVETYRSNHPEVHVWSGDIRQLDLREMRFALNLKPGQLDLLAACPPCEGFSTIRTLNGNRRVDDPRNDLIFEVVRCAAEFVPKAIIVENVPALAEDEKLVRVRTLLGRQGYHGQSIGVVDAADFGVPQHRLRMVLVLSRVGVPPVVLGPVVPPTTARQAIGHLRRPGNTGDKLHDIAALENRSVRIRRLIEAIPKDGGSRSALPPELQLRCHKETTGFKDVYGRMAWDKPAPTLTAGCVNPSKGRFLHPEEDRAISLREAALLQGFPRKYYFSLKRGKFAVASMIGSALPPALAAHHTKPMVGWLTKDLRREGGISVE